MSKPSACNVSAIAARLARVITTPAGLDGGLMGMQYVSPLVAALLLRLVRLRDQHPTLLKSVNKGRLTEMAGGFVLSAGALSEARTLMRSFGLIPMLDWLLRLHPRPLHALVNFIVRPSLSNLDIRNPKVLDTIRIMLLSTYHFLEHRAWLGAKGILNITPEQLAWARAWGVRFWAVDIFINAVRLSKQFRSLQARTKALKAQAAEGYDVAEKEGEPSTNAKLAAEWETWQQTAMITYAWVPLTLHWSTPGGLWTNPLITAAIGSWISYGKLYGAWRRAA